jgi:hypothetical protein
MKPIDIIWVGLCGGLSTFSIALAALAPVATSLALGYLAVIVGLRPGGRS